MNKKEILFGDDARKRLMAGLKKGVDAVRITLGGQGRTVLIESELHTAGLTATKDGVTVMRSIHLEDPTEDLAIRLLRQAPTKTVSEAGDGTTTSVVLVGAIIDSAMKHLRRHNNVTEVTREISILAENAVKDLKSKSVPVTVDNPYTISHVANVSANNDKVLGSVISDAYQAVGDNGVVTVENSKDHTTYFKVIEGIRIDQGLESPFHITDHRNNRCVLENPFILVTDLKIPSAKSIEKLLMAAIENVRPLLIIGELEMDARHTIDKNILEGRISACFVSPPSYGDRRSDMMMDIATAVGGEYITEKTGSDWGSVKISAMGSARRVIVTKDDTAIIHRHDEATASVNARVLEIKERLAEESNDRDKETLMERIANLCGSVATVYVGGKTDAEQKEKRDRADDAVLATRAALDQGILPGGGIALLNLIPKKGIAYNRGLISRIFSRRGPLTDKQVAVRIMNDAFRAPFDQIVENSGKNPKDIYVGGIKDSCDGIGYDVRKDVFGDMVDLGIIDPTKITVSALLNAVSTANTVLMTSAVITNTKQA